MNGSAGAPWPVDAMVAENGALAFVPPPAHSPNEKRNGLQRIWNKRLALSKQKQMTTQAIPSAQRLVFAHSDWAGYSIFEEAFSQGHTAGLNAA